MCRVDGHVDTSAAVRPLDGVDPVVRKPAFQQTDGVGDDPWVFLVKCDAEAVGASVPGDVPVP
jgi:hypothetical protein